MAGEPSRTQIDKLGERLKKGEIAEDDLRLLDEYRSSLSGAYETVIGIIQDQLGLVLTGRPSKSTTSISEKLRRESIRLTQIQDISGCRLVVPDVGKQDQEAINYFPRMGDDFEIPYQTLIDMYLRECAASGKRLRWYWKSGNGKRAAQATIF